MEPATKKLRLYQVRLVTDVCRATDNVLVEQPTGSGKTVQIVTLVAMHLGQRFSHAVIEAPQEHIEEGFVKRDYHVIAFPDCRGVAVPAIQVPRALIKGARESRLGSVKRVIHYLRQPGPLDHAFASTHATLNRLTPEDLPADLSRKALFIDEAHYASADGLSEIVTLWRERGGQLYFFAATPYRGDGRPVKLEGMRAFRRSLAEHIAEGFAPRHLESEIVALGQPGDAITARQFTGEEAPPSSYFDGLIAAICRRWLEDGKPKAIVRVPPMQGVRSGELVSRLIQALSSQGARVLDATRTGMADKQRFLTALEAEKGRTYATSAFDVMVGIQRVLEGTDWPVCSAVYCVGMPGSLNTVVQFLGRAMRLKGEEYPAEQRNRARLVFFVPSGGGAALAGLSLDHSRHALLMCCFLADHEVGQEWIVLREVRRGIKGALGSPIENPAVADAENEADEPLDPEVRADVELAMASAREQIINGGGDASLGEVVHLTAKTRPDLPKAALHRVAAEILAGQRGSFGGNRSRGDSSRDRQAIADRSHGKERDG
jgi:superfamily II DNA or RNA helicase